MKEKTEKYNSDIEQYIKIVDSMITSEIYIYIVAGIFEYLVTLFTYFNDNTFSYKWHMQ